MIPNLHSPSAAQLAVYTSRPGQRPVVLFVQFAARGEQVDLGRLKALAQRAGRHGGELRWSGRDEQVLIGRVPEIGIGACLHFPTRAAALACVNSPEHAALFEDLDALRITVLSEQPRASRRVIALMARVLPRWPFFDNTEDSTPEPGIGTSIMPSQANYETFLAHPAPLAPIVMVNWLRFREQARYSPGDRDAVPISGKAAYYRYGKIAFLTLHSLGARALFVSRYQQVLVGNEGEPAADAWHEFVLVAYPGRAGFKRMTSLRRYRAALHHRAAGLDEYGQGLVVATGLSEAR